MKIKRRQVVEIEGVPAADHSLMWFRTAVESAAPQTATLPAKFHEYSKRCACLARFLVGGSVPLDTKVATNAAISHFARMIGAPIAPGGMRVRSWPEPVEVRPPEAAVALTPYRRQQRYLDSDFGVDLAAADSFPRERVRLVDIEHGWNLEHEEVQGRKLSVVGENWRFHGHGASVLGILMATGTNGRGIQGFLPNHLDVALVSQYWWDPADGEYYYSTAQAICEALDRDYLRDGDILLIEAQHFDEKTGFLLPVEADPVVRCAIECAVERGILVIEPAGNGGIHLDRIAVNGEILFDPDDRSGALVVGAVTAEAQPSALHFSNRGRYVDCCAWGEDVTTCGDGETSRDVDEYIPDFGGTSAAAAIVAGVAAVVQSVARALGRPLSGTDLRELLTRSDLATPTALSSAPVGAMPNIGKILKELVPEAQRTEVTIS